jgi:hypothetical protein
MAALVTLPVAATERYQHLCADQGTCLYIDSRLSYLWIVAAGYFAALAAARSLATVPRHAYLGLLCALVAAVFLVTHSRNLAVAALMEDRAAVLVKARAIACGPCQAWEGLDDDALLTRIDPQELISMHPWQDRPGYWRLYLRYHVAQGRCSP